MAKNEKNFQKFVETVGGKLDKALITMIELGEYDSANLIIQIMAGHFTSRR